MLFGTKKSLKLMLICPHPQNIWNIQNWPCIGFDTLDLCMKVSSMEKKVNVMCIIKGRAPGIKCMVLFDASILSFLRFYTILCLPYQHLLITSSFQTGICGYAFFNSKTLEKYCGVSRGLIQLQLAVLMVQIIR